MEDTVVALEGVTKRFAGHTAVQSLSLRIPRGAIYGLLGPNGAGKTTTIRMIMSIIEPDDGRVVLFGGTQAGRDQSERIGYLPEERGLYRKMKVIDLLVFLAETKGVGRAAAKRGAMEWLAKLGLGEWGTRRVDDLSKGMQQKVQFVSTVLHGPELLILDEPFSGLDPVNSRVMKDSVVELARSGCTILFSTHIMEQAERLCDAVCIIARGRKVVDGPVGEVRRRHGGRHVAIAVEQGLDMVARVLADRSLVTKADDYGHYAEVELAAGADPQRLLTSLIAAGGRLTRFELTEPSLTQVFVDLVGEDAREVPADAETPGA